MTRSRYLAIAVFGPGALVVALSSPAAVQRWSDKEQALIAALSLSGLGPVPADPSNKVADDPRAVELGRAIFADTRFSADGKVSCATCHQPERQFQDDLALGKGVGTTGRRTMPIAGMAYSPFLFWDGRKDSLWSQALGPMESPVEHGGDRTQYAHLIETAYRGPYEALFGPLPDLDHLPRRAGPVADPEAAANWQAMSEPDRLAVSRVYANIGKSIEAFERTIQPPATRFDGYADSIASGKESNALSEDEVAGLRLFIGEGECANCHNGPLFSDTHFHNTGVNASAGGKADLGRQAGALLVRDDPFNCLGVFSDAAPEDCAELRFMTVGSPDEPGAFKTPSLRGAASRAPYMHAGQIATLEEVLQHYNTAPEAQVGHSELRPRGLSDKDLTHLAAFISALDPAAGPPQQAPARAVPGLPGLPTRPLPTGPDPGCRAPFLHVGETNSTAELYRGGQTALSPQRRASGLLLPDLRLCPGLDPLQVGPMLPVDQHGQRHGQQKHLALMKDHQPKG